MTRARVLPVLLLSLGAFLLPPATATATPPELFGPGARPLGRTHEQWFIRWAKWALEAPADVNPMGGARRCGHGQPRSIWLLPVDLLGPTTFFCRVPAGTPLVFSPAGAICSEAFPEDPKTGPALRDCAADFYAPIRAVQVRLDGRRLFGLRRYDIVPRAFVMDWPADNILGLSPGPALSAIAGVLIVLRPLDPGKHRLVGTARFPGGRIRTNLHLRIV